MEELINYIKKQIKVDEDMIKNIHDPLMRLTINVERSTLLNVLHKIEELY